MKYLLRVDAFEFFIKVFEPNCISKSYLQKNNTFAKNQRI